MNWFRFYHEALDDPKVQRLDGETFKVWVNLLCLSSRAKDRGTLPSIVDIAFALRMDEDEIRLIVAELVDRRLLEPLRDGFELHNWEERQPISDNSNVRVARRRQKEREMGETPGSYQKHRDEVFARDGRACIYCGSTDNLVLDHLFPVVLGGDGAPDNLAPACRRCNAGKQGRLPEQAGYTLPPPIEARYQAVRKRLANPVTVADKVTDQPSVTFGNSLDKSREEESREDKSSGRAPVADDHTLTNPTNSKWLPLLGTKVDDIERKFGRLAPEFTAGLVRGTFLDAESQVGPVTAEQLQNGLQAAYLALQRVIAAEKQGGKPIGNLRPYATKIVAAKVREAVR